MNYFFCILYFSEISIHTQIYRICQYWLVYPLWPVAMSELTIVQKLNGAVSEVGVLKEREWLRKF